MANKRHGFLWKYQVSNLGMHRLFLSFHDKVLEASFLDYYYKTNLEHGRICHYLAIFFYAIFGVIDYLLFRETFIKLSVIRFGIIPAMFIAGLILSYSCSSFYKKYWQFVFFLYVLGTGFGCISITAMSAPPTGYAQAAGVILSLIFGYTFIRLRFIVATTAGLILTLCYAVAATYIIEMPVALITIHLYYFFGLNLLGMAVCYYLEISVRSDFYLNRLLSEEKMLVSKANQELEQKVLERTDDLAISNEQLRNKIIELEKTEKERSRLEEQLLQTQKMEAIGRLTGGIAHDFNNLLTIINGYSEMALIKIDSSDPLYKNVLQIHKAGQRAEAVTQQLMAFSRKQIIQPKILNLNDLIEDMHDMLSRLIGEHITLKFIPCEVIYNIKVDPAQIEQIVMNLVINARDAMPDGGVLIIETKMAEIDEEYTKVHQGSKPGSYVVLTVSDNGIGMDKETLGNIFEPFFTTKELGKGTGLGLSTVYGIVKQSLGNIWAYSEVGKGSTFKVYLPGVEEETGEGHLKESEERDLTGVEKILVVEDEEDLRELVVQTLGKHGYGITQAEDGVQAMEMIITGEISIDLLVTDVVMPNMNGSELVEKLKRIYPDMKVLHMSGYTDNSIVYHGWKVEGINFIQKPFSPNDLLKLVREILDS